MLRLDRATDFPRVHVPQKRRRRGLLAGNVKSRRSTSSPSASPPADHSRETRSNDLPAVSGDGPPDAELTAEEMDQRIRVNNAYPGATNSIGSVHQRRWFISLDRVSSGFEPESSGTGRKTWARKRDTGAGELTGFEPFYVRGPDVERSVVTGRLGREILGDEGVKDFVGRRGWRAVLN